MTTIPPITNGEASKTSIPASPEIREPVPRTLPETLRSGSPDRPSPPRHSPLAGRVELPPFTPTPAIAIARVRFRAPSNFDLPSV